MMFMFLPPLKQEGPFREDGRIESQRRAHAARIAHHKRAQSSARAPKRVRRPEKKQQALANEPKLPLDISGKPECVPFRGSSDPFDAFPMEISPEVNHLVAYVRETLLPALFIPPLIMRLTMGTRRPLTYKDSVCVAGGSSFVLAMKAFSNASEGFCLAWLSSHIPAIKRINPGMTATGLSKLELQMRAKSIGLLQQDLKKYEELPRDSLIAMRWHVRALFQSECQVEDRDSAKVHAGILVKLEDTLMNEAQRLHHIMMVMYNATELACKTLERTLIPFDEYLVEKLWDCWIAASRVFPEVPPDYEKIHSCLATSPSPIQTAFTRLRYCLAVADIGIPFSNATEKCRGDLLFGWIATTTFFDMGMLMNMYVDLIQSEIPAERESMRLTEACIILTLVHLLRKCVHQAPIDGVDVRDASHVMIPRLETDLKRAIRLLTPVERSYYQDAYLWMFYTGALHEQSRQKQGRQREASGNTEGTSSSLWFTSMLAKHAYKANIWTWIEAKAILKKFIYDPHLQPQGHLWFENILGM